MEDEFGLTRSSINLRLRPEPQAPVVHALQPQDRVQIVEEAGDLVLVEALRWHPPIKGYAPRSAIIRQATPSPVFPPVQVADGVTIPSVPASLPLKAFESWLASKDESPWLPADYQDAIRLGKKESVGSAIRQTIANSQSMWDEWVAEVRTQAREDTCVLDEWIALMQGGREMSSIRAERIFEQPSEHALALGWVVPVDVLHWTGHVRYAAQEPKYKIWYEVELTKLDRQLKGWYKASLLDEFIVPTPTTDLNIPDNRTKVFDLSRPRLRMPADPEIEDARRAGRAGAQYIDIKRALGWGVLQHNLCGEFCVAALASSDIIPALLQWLPAYPGARDILAKDHGTSLVDLEAMLDTFNMKYEFYRAEDSVAPLTPDYLQKMLDTGRMAITFTGITSGGIVRAHSGIRHWIVIEDVRKVGSSAWLRIYNPFPNREEVYRYEEVVDMPSRSSIGLWIEPRRPRPPEVSVARVHRPQAAIPRAAILEPANS